MFQKIENIVIRGISSCTPSNVERNIESNLFDNMNELENYIKSTGVKERRVADDKTCSSDLCLKAAEKLLDELGWERSEINLLVFVSQTSDYIYPATSCVLQHKLGLSTDCFAIDINIGCPGWVYGLSTLASLMSANVSKSKCKALLLVGETVSKTRSPYDRINLISGDAGTCTALERSQYVETMYFRLNTDGGGKDVIMIPAGGYRNKISQGSLQYKKCDDGVLRNDLNTHMDGVGVFSFAIKRVPQNVRQILEDSSIPLDKIDLYLFHQANKMINDKIKKKLCLPDEKVPANLELFGNTSSTSIPLMLSCKFDSVSLRNKLCLATGFGVGLQWASVIFKLPDDFVCVKNMDY